MFNKRQLIIDIIKDLAIMAVAIIVSASVVVFFGNQIQTIGDSLIEKKKLSMVLEKRGEILAGLREDFSMVGDDVGRIKEAFPPSDDILPFIAELETLAQRTAIEQTYQFGVPVQSPGGISNMPISVIDYSVTAKGNIRTITSYLKEFEKLPFFSGILSMTISGSGPLGWEENAQATMQAKVYTTASE